MCDKDTEKRPQAGTLDRDNPAVSSDRVKAPVADAGRTDFGGDQSRIATNEGRNTPEPTYPFAGKKLARTPPCRERILSSPGVFSHNRDLPTPMPARDTTEPANGSDKVFAETANPQDVDSDVKKMRQELVKLGNQIQDLLEFIMPRHNIHGDIKKKMNAMSMTYNKLKILEQNRAPTGGEKHMVDAQTSPGTSWKDASLTEKSDEADNKRKDISPAVDDRNVKKVKRKKEKTPEIHQNEVEPPLTPNSRWEKVESRGRQKRDKQKPQERQNQRSKPSLPNALVIQKKGELSYAEILSKVKKDASLKELGESVAKIRRTAKGDMILILSKASQKTTSQFQTAIQGALGTEAAVISRIQETLIEIKDLDEVTTTQEIVQALMTATEDLKIDDISVKSLRKAYCGTQSAVVILPTEAAKKVTNLGKLRVGWVICRVRELLKPLKCYKCWRYGHIARNCSNTVDRSKSCIKCGKEGHKAYTCTAEPCCILCSGEGDKEVGKHAAGSSRCPEYKKAYQALLQKRL